MLIDECLELHAHSSESLAMPFCNDVFLLTRNVSSIMMLALMSIIMIMLGDDDNDADAGGVDV